jgi:hypothetical protein
MKIAFIGGPKNKELYDPIIYGRDSLKDIFSYVEQRNTFQASLNQPNKIVYKKTILKHGSEFKYFYIFDGLNISDIKADIQDYWDLSDTIGYDLD